MFMHLGCRPLYRSHDHAASCVIRSMADVELQMCFESAHSVPKLSKLVIIEYDGPGVGTSKATRFSKHK